MNNKEFEIYKDLICNTKTGTLDEKMKRVLRSELKVKEFWDKMDKQGYEVYNGEIIEKEVKRYDKKKVLQFVKDMDSKLKNNNEAHKRWHIKFKTARKFGYTFETISEFLISNDIYNFEKETRNKCYICGKKTDKKFCSEKCAIMYMKKHEAWSNEHEKVFKFLKKKCKKKSKCKPPQSADLYAIFNDLKSYGLIDYDVKNEGYIKPVAYMYVEVAV